MDKVVSSFAALGVPGLVLIVAMSASGFAGAAALTVALSALGGPLGMLGGIAVLGLLILLSQALTEFGFDAIFGAVVQRLLEQGTSKEQMLQQISNYPISTDLKRNLNESVEKFFNARQG